MERNLIDILTGPQCLHNKIQKDIKKIKGFNSSQIITTQNKKISFEKISFEKILRNPIENKFFP